MYQMVHSSNQDCQHRQNGKGSTRSASSWEWRSHKDMSAAQPDLLLSGLAFGESPRWHDGRLWVADWGAQEIITIDRAGGREAGLHLPFGSFQPISFDW